MVFRAAATALFVVALTSSLSFGPAEAFDAPPPKGRRGCPPAVDVPSRWPEASVRSEDDVLAAINRHREQGATCRRARRRPVRPLASSDALREAARRHSAYMAQSGAFAHTLAGCPPSTWIEAAGYKWRSIGQNLAMRHGSRTYTGEDVVALWLASGEGHCETLMDPKWRAAGVGHARAGNRHLWTVDFGDR